MKELELGENNYLEEVKRSTFSPLKSLRVLHLCHNRNLRYISHNAFRGLKDQWTLREASDEIILIQDNTMAGVLAMFRLGNAVVDSEARTRRYLGFSWNEKPKPKNK